MKTSLDNEKASPYKRKRPFRERSFFRGIDEA